MSIRAASPSTPSSASDAGSVLRPSRASFSTAVGLVIEREIVVRLKSRAFMISTIFSIVLFGVLVGFSGPLASLFSSTDTVAVTSTSAEPVAGIDDVQAVTVSDTAEAKAMVTKGTADAAVVEDPSSPVGYTVIAERSAPDSLTRGLAKAPSVQLLDPDAPNPILTYFMGLGLGLVFMMAAMTFGSTIASSVVEEKQSRIVEILLASTSARVLLFGKVIACTILAFAQIGLTVLSIIVGAALSGNDLVLGKIVEPIVWFVPLFVVGFIMVAALYAAAASLVSRTEDLGSTSAPIMMLIMLPYMAVILFNDNETVMAVLSYIPFSAAVAVPMRVFLGTIAWWEPIVSLIILAATTLGALLLATKIFENSVLQSGPKLSWVKALKSQK